MATEEELKKTMKQLEGTLAIVLVSIRNMIKLARLLPEDIEIANERLAIISQDVFDMRNDTDEEHLSGNCHCIKANDGMTELTTFVKSAVKRFRESNLAIS